jgi:cytochrome c oxidase assembly protein subunit 15
MPSASEARRALSRLNAAAALLLLMAGGMVTSTASGLAVPDWPLSYGRWMPAMVGGVFFEHGHRMIAAAVGALIVLMAFWTQWEEQRPGVRRLAWWTLFAVCLQGLLGGITVYYGLPVAVSAAHATLAQTLFCLLVVMAELMGGPELRAAKPVGSLRWTGAAGVAALWTQLVLGAVLRHGGSGIFWHVAGAAAAMTAAGWLGCAVLFERGEAELRRPALALLSLLALQLLLGAATAGLRLQPLPRADPAMIAVATTHLAVGALLLAGSVLLAFRLFRAEAA